MNLSRCLLSFLLISVAVSAGAEQRCWGSNSLREGLSEQAQRGCLQQKAEPTNRELTGSQDAIKKEMDGLTQKTSQLPFLTITAPVFLYEAYNAVRDLQREYIEPRDVGLLVAQLDNLRMQWRGTSVGTLHNEELYRLGVMERPEPGELPPFNVMMNDQHTSVRMSNISRRSCRALLESGLLENYKSVVLNETALKDGNHGGRLSRQSARCGYTGNTLAFVR